MLQWFSGNIGFHHIHHLSPRIPNYNLEHCHKSEPLFRDIKPLTLSDSIRTLGLRLWDESSKKAGGIPEPEAAALTPSGLIRTARQIRIRTRFHGRGRLPFVHSWP